jgi:hypothetical protein
MNQAIRNQVQAHLERLYEVLAHHKTKRGNIVEELGRTDHRINELVAEIGALEDALSNLDYEKEKE